MNTNRNLIIAFAVVALLVGAGMYKLAADQKQETEALSKEIETLSEKVEISIGDILPVAGVIDYPNDEIDLPLSYFGETKWSFKIVRWKIVDQRIKVYGTLIFEDNSYNQGELTQLIAYGDNMATVSIWYPHSGGTLTGPMRIYNLRFVKEDLKSEKIIIVPSNMQKSKP